MAADRALAHAGCGSARPRSPPSWPRAPPGCCSPARRDRARSRSTRPPTSPTQSRSREARDYRSGQRLLFVGGLAAQGARARRCWSPGARAAPGELLERAGERPVLGGAAAAGGLVRRSSVVDAARSTSPRTSARSTSASRPRTSPPGSATGRSRTRSAPCSRGAIGTGALALIRRSPRNWWIPGSAAVVAIGAVFSWLAPVVLAPALQRLRAAARTGQARSDVLELGERGRRRDRRGLHGRREPPQHRDQRLRRRPRADQARRPLRQPAGRARPRRAPLGRRPRARARLRERHPARDPLRRDRRRRWRCCSSRARREALARRTGAEPGTPAFAARARDRAVGHLVRDRGRRQPALARGRARRPTPSRSS